MPLIIHSADRARIQRMVGGLRVGDRQGILLDANLSSTAAVAKDAVLANTLKLHVALRAMSQRVVASLDMVNSLDATYLSGLDADKPSMLALAPGITYGSLGL